MSGDHGSQGPTVVGICIAFAVLTFITLVLRLFARIYVLGKMGLDDCKWSLIISVLASTGQSTNLLERPHYRSMRKDTMSSFIWYT